MLIYPLVKEDLSILIKTNFKINHLKCLISILFQYSLSEFIKNKFLLYLFIY